MAELSNQFTTFVNTELPKRLSTEIDPTTLEAGQVPVSTGKGLDFKFTSLGSLLDIGLITEHNLPLSTAGSVILTQSPLGGVVLDTALIQLQDGSYIEVIGVQVSGDTLTFLPEDYQAIKNIAASVTVTYLGNIVK